MKVSHLRLYVIRPTLHHLGLWSAAAEELLLGTAAQESRLGEYLRQHPHGPAVGIYQMEPRWHDALWNKYIQPRAALTSKIIQLAAPVHLRLPQPSGQVGNGLASQMTWNLAYATAMARAFYLAIPRPLPDADNLEALAVYWKRHWNSELGAGTVEQFLRNYRELVLVA